MLSLPRPNRVVKDPSLDLHKLLDEAELSKIKEAFDQADGRRMNRAELKAALYKYAKIEYDEEKYNLVFDRMNVTCSGIVSWDEFISYLILLYEQQDVSMEFKTLDPPIPLPPNMLKSNHRHAINRIKFFPTVKPDRSWNWHDGSIITCSHDGTINYWSLDMQLERTVQSTCPYLWIQGTWVTDMVPMPDCSVICTSSSERDLRFYDTSARKFELRVMVTSFPHPVTTMYYSFNEDVTVPSKLVLGDMGGYVKVLLINTDARGPFRSQPGVILQQMRYDRLVKGGIPDIKVLDLGCLHSDYVRQVEYYSAFHSVVSCAQCPKRGMLMTDIGEERKMNVFKVVSGVWCFTLGRGAHLVATGGPDCQVRLWNPFMPKRPLCTFYGHHTGIVRMVIQDAKFLYSLSKDKCIKVWDVGVQSICQTYLEIPAQLGERNELTTLYNQESRQWIIGSIMIAVLPLSPKQSSEHTDGHTHTSSISCILYNKLFKTIVTCGLDSYIIVWDPWDGRRLLVVKEAHTLMLHGEVIPVEITAATFDPGFSRLLTGAHDGTLKIWDFNTGTCLRNMNIDNEKSSTEVQSVIWVKGRILAMGWNRRVTEFADSGEAIGPGGAYSKNWDLRHTEDISASAVKIPETLATSSYVGELILWRLETGQPYKKFNVSNPTARIKIQYTLSKQKDEMIKRRSSIITRRSRLTSLGEERRQSMLPPPDTALLQGPMRAKRGARSARRVSTVALPEECTSQRNFAVHCMVFLTARKMDPRVGTLLVSLENGVVQVWSHHISGGFITSFSAIHKAGDYVLSMASDASNEFLFVGTTVGYIKTWLLKNYVCLPEDVEHLCMPKYRLMFPFLWGSRFMGRAMRLALTQEKPMLMNSYRGHFMPISGLTYINENKILISCCADFSARMWTLSGRYLQTIGTFKPWKHIERGIPVPDTFEFTIPPDIRRTCSSTSLRVLHGGTLPKGLTFKQLQKQAEKNVINVDHHKIYGKPLDDPILGHHYNIPQRTTQPKTIQFDTSLPYIPVYQHLITPNPVPIVRNYPSSRRSSIRKSKDKDVKM